MMGRGAVIMPGQQQVDPGLGDRVERQLLRPIALPSSGPSPTGSANKRMVGDEDARTSSARWRRRG
jgi:hypothetical protein